MTPVPDEAVHSRAVRQPRRANPLEPELPHARVVGNNHRFAGCVTRVPANQVAAGVQDLQRDLASRLFAQVVIDHGAGSRILRIARRPSPSSTTSSVA